jgi:signal transduction histidine kinase
MSENKVEPHRVTKPIQLLAAWLVGLFVIDGSFLSAAKILDKPEWLPPLLVIAAIINVPLFLICIFLLQTKFRPEMQEDVFYATYIQARLTTQRESKVAESQLALAKSKDRLAALEASYQKSLEALNIESSQLQKLKETYQQLEQANRSAITEKMAHEIQTRLQALIATTENLLLESNESAVTKEDISQQSRKILQSAFAIDTVLQNYRYDRKEHFAFQLERIDKVIFESLSIYEYEASQKNIRFLVELEKVRDQPPQIAMSRSQLQLAINNIIDNAIRYSYRGNKSEPSEIKIIGKSTKDFYSISFENVGVEVLEFGTKSGMGLFIIEQVINSHGGTIVVENNALQKKKGLHQFRLTISLPYVQEYLQPL